MKKAIDICKEYADETQVEEGSIKVLLHKKYIADLCLRMNLNGFKMTKKKENNFFLIVVFEVF